MTSRDGDPRRTSVRLGLQTGLLVVGVLAVVGLLIFVIYARAADTAADTTLREVTSNIDRPNEAPPGVHVVVITRPFGSRVIATSTGVATITMSPSACSTRSSAPSLPRA